MRKMTPLVVAIAVLASRAHAQVITASIDASVRGVPIQPLIYGMFVEHIGSLLEGGFRAELLDDRKFYFAVGPQPPATGRGGRGGPRRTWQPLATDGSVAMDSAHAYASAHVPVVTLAGADARGIRQTGVAITAGKAYTGRIVIAGDPGAAVSVSLISAEGTAGRRRYAWLHSTGRGRRERFASLHRPRAPTRHDLKSPAPVGEVFVSARSH